jgi:hypothetical protein
LFASPAPTRPVTREEPEKIKKWREEQKKRLEEKGRYRTLKENYYVVIQTRKVSKATTGIH